MAHTHRKQQVEVEGASRRWGVYARISKDEAGDELGVRRQLKLCRDLLPRVGGTIVDEYVDNGISASKRARRPQWLRLLDDVRAGRVDGVLVYNPDRLTRDMRELETLIDLLASTGTIVETVRSGSFSLATAHDRAIARQAGVWARLEAERLSERLTDKYAELAKAGVSNHGRRPFGYCDDRLTPHEVEAGVIVELFARVAAGETLTGICDAFTARGVRSSTGRPFTLTTLRQLLRNPRYVGRRMHCGRDVGAGKWQPIVDEATFARANTLLTERARRRSRASRRYLLSGGLIVCGKCGVALVARPHYSRGQTTPVYVCPGKRDGGCAGVQVRATLVEHAVTALVVEAIEGDDLARALAAQTADSGHAAQAVEAARTELAQLADAKRAGALSVVEYVDFRDAAQARLSAASADLAVGTSTAAAGQYLGQRGKLRAAWDSLTVDVQRAIVRAVLDRVTILPTDRRGGRVFDPDRIVPSWVVDV